MITSVFFDLDGTLFNTAPDLTHALNLTLTHHGKPKVTIAQLRDYIHGGSNMMVSYGFKLTPDHPEFSAIKTEFLQHYLDHIAVDTHLYEGIESVLAYLEMQQYKFGIVTNKPGWLTEPLLMRFGFDKRTQCIVSGDSLARRKPHPDPLLYACELTQSHPAKSVYIGDTLGDVEASKAAGMLAFAVSYGYHPIGSSPDQWHADCIIHHPKDIITSLQHYSSKVPL